MNKEEREQGLVSQTTMIRYIRNRLKTEYETDVPINTVKAILDIFDDEVYALIAENKYYKFLWGKVGGEVKAPYRVAGKFSELKSVIDNFGYSAGKNGYPYVVWSKQMKVYDLILPEDFFARPDQRYTSAARQFRKDANLPEIPEYDGLPEEKIEEYCKRADDLNIEKLTHRKRCDKKRDKKYDAYKKKALHTYWEMTDHVPMGADQTWTGPQRDTVSNYLNVYLHEEDSPVDKLEVILKAKDIGEWKYELDNHPELGELEEKYRKEIEEQGLIPKPHIKREFEEIPFGLKYKGEVNPWGIETPTTGVALTKMRQEKVQKMEEMLLNDINGAKKEIEENSAEDNTVEN